MAKTNKTLRRLTGGVSQQPSSQRRDSQCTEQINWLSDSVDGLVRRPGSTFVGEIETQPQTPYNEGDAEVFTHPIIRDGDTELMLSIANGKLSLVDLSDGSKVQIVDASSTEITTAAQTYLNYSNASLLTHPYAAVTIADTTFILNKEQTTAMASSTTGGQQFADPEIKRGTIFIQEGAYNTEYTIQATDGDDEVRTIKIKTSDGITGAGTAVDSKTDNICAAIHAALKDTATSRTDYAFNTTNYPAYADEDTGITITYTETGTFNNGSDTFAFLRDGSVLLWTVDYTGDSAGYTASNVTIDISDSYGDSLADSFNDTRGEFAGLPLTSAKDYNVKITGNPESNIDDYYVEFVLDEPNPVGAQRGTGKWVEAVKPGVEYILDAAQMPHQLVKVNASSYMFKEVDWDDKVIGDTITDPEPSFVDSKINDIFFFKGRLGLLSGENVILSELDDPYNFWRSTVVQVVATDRIDIQSSVNQVTELNFAVPFSNQMVVFSDRTQFIINFGSQGLTPSTASLAQISAYQASKNVPPITIDNNIIFLQERSSSMAVYEMFPTGATELSFEAQEISQQIPSYILGKAIRMTGSSLANAIIIQTDSSENMLYIYKFYNQGRERVLSSWFKYDFDVNDIKGIHYVADKCYKVNSLDLLAASGVDATHVIDYFRLDNTETISFCADMAIPHTSMAAVSIDASGNTDVRLPLTGGSQFPIGTYYDRDDELVVFDDSNVQATLLAPDTGNNFDIKITGDWTSKTFWMAIKFDSEYEFSHQYLKRSNAAGLEAPIVDGRTTVKWAEVYVTNTQYLQLEVAYPDVNRDTTTKTFTGNILGTVVIGSQEGETGVLRSIVGVRNNVPTVKLLSTTHQTATITGASFVVEHTSKLRGLA